MFNMSPTRHDECTGYFTWDPNSHVPCLNKLFMQVVKKLGSGTTWNVPYNYPYFNRTSWPRVPPTTFTTKSLHDLILFFLWHGTTLFADQLFQFHQLTNTTRILLCSVTAKFCDLRYGISLFVQSEILAIHIISRHHFSNLWQGRLYDFCLCPVHPALWVQIQALHESRSDHYKDHFHKTSCELSLLCRMLISE